MIFTLDLASTCVVLGSQTNLQCNSSDPENTKCEHVQHQTQIRWWTDQGINNTINNKSEDYLLVLRVRSYPKGIAILVVEVTSQRFSM